MSGLDLFGLAKSAAALGLVWKGDRARDGLDWVTARQAYETAVRWNPRRAAIWVQYGHALKESGALGEAEIAYRNALTVAPESADGYLQLGHVLKLQGRLQDAVAAYERAVEIAPDHPDTVLELHRARRQIAPSIGLPSLRFVSIGTTGLCNASCVHCPTGKVETAHTPKTPMPMALFSRLIEQMHSLGLEITDQFSFGLFGDGLVDPFVVERAKLVRKYYLYTPLSINTNGAAFNRARHQPLAELVSLLTLHVESIDPETYDYLMQPLRFERVSPKFDEIFATFPGKVRVSVPVSRMNLHQLDEIRAHFTERGALEVVMDPLASRCADDTELFYKLALNPVPIRCPSSVLTDLIVDCDGSVLVCCQDFRRAEPIGDLTRESLEEVLQNMARKRVRQIFDSGRHEEMATCSRCFGDVRRHEPAH